MTSERDRGVVEHGEMHCAYFRAQKRHQFRLKSAIASDGTHLKELSELFVQVVRQAREMGLVKLGTIAVDGTKVKANASRHKAMSYVHMLKADAELKAQITALLDKARAADEAEKNEPELDIPAEIARRQDRLDAIAAARTRVEQCQREADLERGRSVDDDQKPRG